MIKDKLLEDLLQFRAERDWEQFHTPRNLASSVSIEAAELLELFQWEEKPYENKAKLAHLKEEIADVAIYLSYLCHDLDIDLDQAVAQKIRLNAQKYPVARVYGKAEKYTKV